MKKPLTDSKSCASCESYKPVNPGDEAGYCHLMPPLWVDHDGDAGWSRPVVEPRDTCRMFLQKLNS